MWVFVSHEPNRLRGRAVEPVQILINGRINNPGADEQRAAANESLGTRWLRFIP